ncbi:uncharacterized protein LOC119298702 [Triticum dicoccoides]|uniref:uncharacterized protein LOC119298702 n=1 Tax=Triticum dicoccoides TaxID=85692 RepID=UPI00188EF6D0|nr:uncharacterized protein LOC119298702 [Triticum dicoccoides]
MRGLFRHDTTTRWASVELWVVVPAVLVLIKFAVGSLGPRFVLARQINPAVMLLHTLSYYSVSYTLGLMKPSVAKEDAGATFNVFFQVWAVLIVTLQDSASIGRPYRPKEMTLVDLLSSLWSANQLRTHTALDIKVPLWVIWTIHACRIIWYFLSSSKAAQASDDNVKLVSDYMSLETRSTNANADTGTMEAYNYLVDGEDLQEKDIQQRSFTDANAATATMEGCNYLVDGEDRQKKKIEPPSFRFELNKTRPGELITVDKVWTWTRPGNDDDRLLGKDTDGDNKFKDVCLSFALYKMLRRRFLNLPIPEAKDKAVRDLVANVILEDTREYERAFRVTEVELSFLQDFSYSKHAVVFAGGFPIIRPILSLLMAAVALYLAYAVRDIPSRSIAKTTTGHMTRISHGVLVTHFLIFIVVCRELWEIGVYVLSQWTKVIILCHYIRLKIRQGQDSTHQRMVAMLARIMFRLVWRGEWNQKIHLHNLLMRKRPLGLRFVKLPTEVKKEIFGTLKGLIAQASLSAKKSPSSPVETTNNQILQSYLGKAFPDKPGDGPNGPTVPSIERIHKRLQRDTHKILGWHVATSLCQKDSHITANIGDDMYKLVKAPADGVLSELSRNYNTAVTLSNYCVHLVKEALLPDNGLMARKVFHAVRVEVRDALRGSRTPGDDSIFNIGTQLKAVLKERYSKEDLWKNLARFWVGYLLYLSASTRVAKHRMHLQGRGELTTHLWALLSHAGFLGEDTAHGQQLLDTVDGAGASSVE